MSPPMLSVVVPVYNDPEGIRVTLESLTSQRDTPTYEVLVVDNDSTDSSGEVINDFETQYPEIVTGLSETDIQSSYAARNTGIKHATGDLLAFIDADMTVEETWAADICEAFSESDIDYLGYNVEMYIPDGDDTFWARYDVAMGLPVKHYLETKQFAPTCALVVRREVFDEVGLFDEELISGGDKEFGNRVYDTKFSFGYASEIVVRHPSRSTIQSHVKKAVRIGIGQYQLWKEHDLASHPLSPIKYLPPNVSRIKYRKRRDSNLIIVYVLACFLKMIQTGSSVAELLK